MTILSECDCYFCVETNQNRSVSRAKRRERMEDNPIIFDNVSNNYLCLFCLEDGKNHTIRKKSATLKDFKEAILRDSVKLEDLRSVLTCSSCKRVHFKV